MRITTSRKLAIGTVLATFLLTAYCASQGMEGLGSTVFVTGIGAAFGLYSGKQYQERKIVEATNKQLDNGSRQEQA